MQTIKLDEIVQELLMNKQFTFPEHLEEHEISVLISLITLNLKRSHPLILIDRQDRQLFLI